MTTAEITLNSVSYRVCEDFEPLIVEARAANRRTGWGEGHIPPGHMVETIDTDRFAAATVAVGG